MRKLQQPRDTTANNDSYIGLEGQFTVDTDRWEIRLHDGIEPGGHRILNLSQLKLLFMSKDSEFGGVVFDEADRGVLTRIGDKQYALRLLDGYNGIKVSTSATGVTENNNGESADFFIGIDQDFIDDLITTAGKLVYIGPTTGTDEAYTLVAPEGWANGNGSVVAFDFHVKAKDAATLKIDTTVDGATVAGTAYPILTADGNNKISHCATEGRLVVAMRLGDNYYLIGEEIAAGIGIEPIVGLEATNVQDALEELQAEIDELGGDSGTIGNNPYYSFGNGSSLVEAITDATVDLENGECRLYQISVSSGTGGTDNPIVHTLVTYVYARYSNIYYRGTLPVEPGVGGSLSYSSSSIYALPLFMTRLGATFSGTPTAMLKSEVGVPVKAIPAA